ncbi:putative Ig domain-containing protein, partial [bacterium]|nr:putative Ig domain-containing protein [bacterium]
MREVTSRDVLLSVSMLVGFGISCALLEHSEAAAPYFPLDLTSSLDSQPKHSLKIGLLESGESEWKDTVPPPDVSGFDFYISSGLAWPWDRLSIYLISQVSGERVYSWRVVAVVPTGKELTISWDASGAPANINPYFVELDVGTGEPVGDVQSMKTTTSVLFEGGVLAASTKAFEFRMYDNMPPDLDSIGDRSTSENQELSFQLSATDPDGDALVYSGTPLPSGATLNSSTGVFWWKPGFEQSGDYSVTFTVTDDAFPNKSDSETVNIEVLNTNRPPSIDSVSVSPTISYTNTTLTAAPSGWSDADGDSPAYNYQWKKNGSDIPGATTSALSGTNFSKGDVITCEVTPWDGTDAGAPKLSNAVSIANSAPSISSVSVSPTTAYTNTTLTVTPSGWSDVDGDSPAYNYQWKKNGSVIPGATASTLSGTNFSKEDIITCEVTPWDGADAGTPKLSNAVSIRNSTPSISSVSVSPTTAYTNTTLMATPSGWSDADGDSPGYDYQWRKNGSNISGATASTLSGTNFDKGDVITCEVTPWDGAAAGTPKLSNEVTIIDDRRTLDLEAGWNLVGISREPLDPWVSSIFAGAAVGTVWGWDGSKYVPASSVEPLEAYWVRTTAPASVQYDCFPVSDPVPELSGQWSMFAVAEETPLPMDDPSVVGSIWGWDGTKYVRAENSLQPDKGYWIATDTVEKSPPAPPAVRTASGVLDLMLNMELSGVDKGSLEIGLVDGDGWSILDPIPPPSPDGFTCYILGNGTPPFKCLSKKVSVLAGDAERLSWIIIAQVPEGQDF